MQDGIIEAVRERYQGDSKAIRQARKAGVFELILVNLAQYDLLREIADLLMRKRQADED